MNVQAWVAKLDKAQNWTKQWREVEALLKRGERETLFEVVRACAGARPQQSGRRSVLERIIETLAFTPGRDNVQTLARVFAELPASVEPQHPRSWGLKRARYFASLLALAQAPRDLLELDAWAGDDANRRELLACIVGELVLRERFDATLAEQARAIVRGHPLGVLPLELLAVERDFPSLMPQLAVGRSARSYAPTLGQVVSTQGETRALTPVPGDDARLLGALANWRDESNGMLEAGVWSWNAPLAADDFGLKLLGDLNLEATHALQKLRRTQSRDALNMLWSAANAGGAYNSGEYGAWGRLLAWRSLGVLSGCAADASVETVSEAAARCAWFDFAGESAWFYDIMGDIGLACLRPDGASVAVVAGTDTD